MEWNISFWVTGDYSYEGGIPNLGHHKSQTLPADFYGPGGPGVRISDFDDDDSDEAPSYRNGAPVNGGRQHYGQNRGGGAGRGIDGSYARGGFYGDFDREFFLKPTYNLISNNFIKMSKKLLQLYQLIGHGSMVRTRIAATESVGTVAVI